MDFLATSRIEGKVVIRPRVKVTRRAWRMQHFVPDYLGVNLLELQLGSLQLDGSSL